MSEEVARCLVSLGCFKVSLKPPFTYGSGLQGPVYCDNRKIFSHPEEREFIFKEMCQAVANWGGEWSSVVGIATGGIPFGFALAQERKCPFLYVRAAAKKYGKGRALEGDWKPGEGVILVEDLVNQGVALQRACRTLRGEGLRPVACFSVVDYQTGNAQKICQEERVEHLPLTNLDTLLRVIDGQLDDSERDSIARWRRDPQSWAH